MKKSIIAAIVCILCMGSFLQGCGNPLESIKSSQFSPTYQPGLSFPGTIIRELDSSWAPAWQNISNLWHLNDLAGSTTAYDSVGGALGTAINTIFGVIGKLSTAASLNGASSRISIPIAPVAGAQSFTIAAWIKTATLGTRKQILSYGTGSAGQGVWFFINTSNQVELDLSSIAGPSSVTTVTDGLWHHVAAVNNAGTIQIYVDGLASGASQVMAPNVSACTGNNCSLGYSIVGVPGTNGWWFNGTMDEVAVWSTALAPADVQTIYNRQASN